MKRGKILLHHITISTDLLVERIAEPEPSCSSSERRPAATAARRALLRGGARVDKEARHEPRLELLRVAQRLAGVSDS